MKYNTSIIWFRNDLRLHDNEALFRAAESSDRIIPVYCFDPRHFETTSFGFPKTGPFRRRFLEESVKNLAENLEKKGSGLVVFGGKPEEIIPELCEKYNCNAVFYNEEVTSEETEIEKKLTEKLPQKTEINTFFSCSLYHPDDVPFEIDKTPDVFTAFRKKAEKYSSVRKTFQVPEVLPGLPSGASEEGDINSQNLPETEIEIDSRSVLSFKGGEDEAMTRLKSYFWHGDHLKKYKETRNGLLGADYSSKFSPWLANGCISPRFIYEEVKSYEKERKSNQSTYWMVFELIWRDYFGFIFMKYGNKLFTLHGIKEDKATWITDEALFESWQKGETGIPFIDANMRELNQTGFMSNRGRQNVASFLAKNLQIDWRMGAEWFESMLLDYDPCSNYGNWAYVSGVGNDPRDRYFNIVSQAERYDSKGEYVKHWLPELKSLPKEFIHEPYKSSSKPAEYPEPITNLEAGYARLKKIQNY